MTQDLGGRLPDLLRFAVALCGDGAAAQGLLRQALHRAAAEPGADDVETAVRLTRVWVARGFLAEGMELGAPAAADADRRLPAEPGADDPDARFARLSKLGRAVVVLRFVGGLPVRDIARTVGGTTEGIARYLSEQLIWLGVAAGAGRGARPGSVAAAVAELVDRSVSSSPDAEFDAAVAAVRAALPARFAAADTALAVVGAHGPATDRAVLPLRRPIDMSGLEHAALPPSVADRAAAEPGRAASAADGTVFHEIVGSSSGSANPRRPALRHVHRPAGPDGAPTDDFGVAGPARTSTRRAIADPHAAGAAAERSGSRRVLLALALVVVLAAAILIGVLATHQLSTQHGSRTGRAAAPVPGTLPGTIVLGTWRGSGDDVVTPPVHQVDPGRELALSVRCSGSGPVTVGPVVNTDCSGPVTASVDSGTALRLQVSAPSGTSWRFDLVDQPQSGTDGALVELPNRALTTPPDRALGSHAGTGSADVPLARPGASGPGIVDLRIVVTCTGNGLTISTADGSVDNQYTRTCFPDWSYEFDATSVRVPTTLHVTADPHTSWHLVVVPF